MKQLVIAGVFTAILFKTSPTMGLIGLILIALLFVSILLKKVDEKKQLSADYYKDKYKSKYLFSKNEYQFYGMLKPFLAEHNLQAFPKVRLADLLEPKAKSRDTTLFNKIKSKHVDFAIAEKDKVKWIIELDDASHDRRDRIDRDQFVDAILTGCGYKILHTREYDEETIKSFLTEETPV